MNGPPRANRDDLVVAIDTREQLPYLFPRSETVTLKTGDYSIVGHEARVCIERKSKADLFGSVGKGRERFEREIQRMAEYDYAAIVIEASLPDLLIPPPRTAMNPRAVVATILAWSVKYGVHVYLAGDRLHANTLVLRILEYWLKHRVDGSETK